MAMWCPVSLDRLAVVRITSSNTIVGSYWEFNDPVVEYLPYPSGRHNVPQQLAD